MSFWAPPMYCMGCHQSVCHGDCLASHRDRYSCHNPLCVYHAPSPLRPDPDPEPPEEISPAANVTETPATTTENTDPDDRNLAFRETITREWWLVNGQLVQVPGRRIRVTPAATATASAAIQTEPGEATPNRNQAGGASTVSLPEDITDEEIGAQARLWAQRTRRGGSSAPNRPRTPS